MGGDGFLAPIAAYSVQGHQVTGAVGGGVAALTIEMDNRYCSLVSWLTLTNVQVAAADADFRFTMFGTGTEDVPLIAQGGLATSIGFTTPSINELWRPPPVVLPGGPGVGQIVARMLNVDADVYQIACMIYIFDIDVRTKTPMGPLLWARGSA